jgi:hypothetical protein
LLRRFKPAKGKHKPFKRLELRKMQVRSSAGEVRPKSSAIFWRSWKNNKKLRLRNTVTRWMWDFGVVFSLVPKSNHGLSTSCTHLPRSGKGSNLRTRVWKRYMNCWSSLKTLLPQRFGVIRRASSTTSVIFNCELTSLDNRKTQKSIERDRQSFNGTLEIWYNSSIAWITSFTISKNHMPISFSHRWTRW